jgi:hypothetical protein
MTKLQTETWFQRPRSSRLASVLWPDLTTPEVRKEMNDIAKAEGKRPPFGPNLIPYVSPYDQLKRRR